MLAIASKVLSTAAPAETRPLAARRNDDLHLTLASGTPERRSTALHKLSVSPGPLKGPGPNPEEVTTPKRH